MKVTNMTVKSISKVYFSFAMIFGFYLMFHANISHGAGFAGGVMIALGFIQALLVSKDKTSASMISADNARYTALLSIGAFIVLSCLGYIYGNAFMSDFIDHGERFTALSSIMVVIYNIALCLGVTGCLLLIYLSLFDRDRG